MKEKIKPTTKEPQETHQPPNISGGAFFLGVSILLIFVAMIFTVSRTTVTAGTITLGSCEFKTEFARTDAEKARGLSGRTSIPKDYAMVFPYQQEQPFFWMKDMLASIDIIWVSKKKVVEIDASLPVDDGLTTYTPSEPIDWVIEVAAGRASECGIMPGNRVRGLHY